MTQNFDEVGLRAAIQGIDAYVRDANRLLDSTGKVTAGVDKAGKGMASSSKDALKFAAALVGVQGAVQVAQKAVQAIVFDTVGAAIAFESSFAGIRKTVDLSEEGFAKLAATNRALAKEIPVSVDGINRIGELAGQLGVRGVENIAKFEKTIASLAVTTNLTEEAAALAFAQIANVLKLPQSEIDRLGSAVVGLGNNFATTESQIVDFVQRIAGTGAVVGLTAGEISGIGTAFASAGNEAEAGGTAIQKVLLEMLNAVETKSPALAQFAQVADVTVEEFTRLFREDAAEAFTLFVEGLADLGPQASAALDDIGLSDARLARSFLSTAQSGDVLRRAIKLGTEEFDRNNALQEEAAKRFGTTASQIQLTKNRIHDMQITVGTALLTAINPLVRSTNEWIDAHGEEAARKIGEAIQAMIPYVQGLAEELGRIVGFVQTLAAVPGIDLAIQIAMSNADKLTLALLAGVLASTVGGPLAGVVVGAGVFAALGIADLMSGGGGSGIESRASAAGISAADAKAAEKAYGASLTVEALKAIAAEAARRGSTVGATAADNAWRRMHGEADLTQGPVVYGPEEAPPGYVANVTASTGGGAGNRTYTPLPDEEKAKRTPEPYDYLKDAEAALERMQQEQISDLDNLGALLVSALRRQAQAIYDAQAQSITATRELAEEAFEDRRKLIEKERDTAIRAIDDELRARRAATESAIQAIRDEEKAEERADLLRERALTYDATERARIDAQLRSMDRRDREDALRASLDEAEQKAEDDKKLVQESAAARLDALAEERKTVTASLDAMQEEARKAYEATTDQFTLESAARQLALGEEIGAMTALLNNFAPEWRTAGRSWGAALVRGLEDSVGKFLGAALGGVPGSSQNAAADAARRKQIDELNALGRRAKDAGLPESSLELTRKQITDLGGVPTFVPPGHSGGFLDQFGRPHFLAAVQPGEWISAASGAGRGGDGGGASMVVEAGAFEGMFAGATFGGDAAANGREIARAVREVLTEQNGRGFFLARGGRR